MKEILHFKLPGKIQPFELISISKWIRPENSAGCTKRRDFLVFPPHPHSFGCIEHKARQADSHIYLQQRHCQVCRTTFIKSFFVRYISLPDIFWIFISFHIPLDTLLIFLFWQHSLSLYLALKCVEWLERSQGKNSSSCDCLCLTENTQPCTSPGTSSLCSSGLSLTKMLYDNENGALDKSDLPSLLINFSWDKEKCLYLTR